VPATLPTSTIRPPVCFSAGAVPGAGYRGIQSPELGDTGPDGLGHVDMVGRVAGDRPHAVRVAQLGGQLPQPLGPAAGDDDPVAALQELTGGLRPDAGAAAGDEGDRAGRSFVHARQPTS
jgi:hypothetical protein